MAAHTRGPEEMDLSLCVTQLYYRARALTGEALATLRNLCFRVAGHVHAPLPGDLEVSSRWVDELLRGRSTTDLSKPRVSGAELSSLEESRGMSAELNRLVVTYTCSADKDCEAHAEGACQLSFVLKRSRAGLSERRRVVSGSKWREAYFYRSRYADLAEHMVPEVLYASGSQVFAEYVVLVRDLTRDAQTVLACWLFENGVRSPLRKLPVEMDTLSCVEAIFMSAAELHAKTWRDPSLLKSEWLKGANWYQGRGRAEWELAVAQGRRSWASVKKKFLKGPNAGGLHLAPQLVDVIDKSFERSSWDMLQSHLQDPNVPFMLCHGDFHCANMFLQRQAGESDIRVLLVDWAEVGPWEGTTDLAQMVISNVSTELSRQHGKALLEKYWRRLIELGVDEREYPFQTCWDAYCRGGAERWIWIFARIADFSFLSLNAIQYFHDQLWAFMQVHNLQEYYHLKSVVC